VRRSWRNILVLLSGAKMYAFFIIFLISSLLFLSLVIYIFSWWNQICAFCLKFISIHTFILSLFLSFLFSSFFLFCFVLFFVLFCFVLFCFVLFCFVLFCFVLFCLFVLFVCFVCFCLRFLFPLIPFCFFFSPSLFLCSLPFFKINS
jgi:hypothetical protein